MENGGTPKRRGRLVRILLGAVAAIVLLIALAPTILSWGIAKSIARNALVDSINGDADVARVSLGWFSNQRVEGLAVRDAAGENVAKLDVTVQNGLLSLAGSGGSSLDVALSGSIKGTIEKDGSIGFAKLAKPSSGGAGGSGSGSGGSGSGKKSDSASEIAAKVSIKDLSIVLDDKASGKTYALTGLSGEMLFDGKTRSAKATLASPTEFAGSKGSIQLAVDLGNLPLAGDLGAMTIDLALGAKDIKVPAGGVEAEFRTIECNVKSPGLSQNATVTAKAEGIVDGKTPSALIADLTIAQPINAKGGVNLDPANVVGSIEASNLPTSLLQPSLVATGLVASEDIGPIIQKLVVKAPGGTGQRVVVQLASEKAELELGGLVSANERSISDGTLSGTLRATSATVKRLAKIDVLGAVELRLAGRDLRWAAPREGAAALDTFVGSLELQPLAPLVWLQAKPNADQLPSETVGSTPIAVALGPSTLLLVGRQAADRPLTVDVKASVALGSAGAPPSAPTSPNVTLRSDVAASFKRLENAVVATDLPLEPSFLLAVTGKSFSKSARLVTQVRDLDYSFGGTHPLGGLSIDADVRIAGETAMYVEQLKRDVPLRDLTLRLQGADASKELAVALTGLVDATSVDVLETLRDLPAEFNGIDPLALNMRGQAKIDGLTSASLIAWLGQHRELIDAAGIKNLTIQLKHEPAAGSAPSQRVDLTLAGEPVHGNVQASVASESGSIEQLELAGVAPEALVRALQSSKESKVVLAQDAPFALALSRPTSFRFADLREGKLPAGLAARLTVASAVVSSAPGIQGGVAVDGLDVTTEVDPSATAATIKGSFGLRGTAGPDARLERASIDLAWAKQSGPSLLGGLTGTVTLDGVNVPWVESLLGKEQGAYSKWTGDNGSLALKLDRNGKGERIQLVPKFPRITSGTVDVLAEGQSLTATAKGLAVRVPAASLTELAAKPAPKQANATKEGPKYSFQSDLALTLSDATATLPNGLVNEGDRMSGGSMNVALSVEPIALNVIEPAKPLTTLKVPAIDLSLQSTDFKNRIELHAKDRGQGAAGEASFKIDGAVVGLSDAEGRFSGENARIDLSADVRDIPTVLVDLIASTNGKLVRSLGDRLAFKANASKLSKTSGELSAEIKAPFADLTIPQLSINKNGIARIVPEKPMTASFAMSPGIKEDLLYAINTIFVDVDLVKERASLNVSELRYSLDGDLSKLDGVINMEVGEVALRNGKPVSVILMLLNTAAAESEGGSEGRIEPLSIKINNGRLTYDNFGLKLFRLSTPEGAPAEYANAIDMKGDVNLATMTVTAITTKLPLSQFANYSGDLSDILAGVGGRDSEVAKSLFVGITLYGPLYDEKGHFKELSKKVEPPDLKGIAKDPGALLKVIPGLFDSGGKGKGDTKEEPAPAKMPVTEPAKPAKEKSPKDKEKDKEKDKAPANEAGKDKPKDKPKEKKKKEEKEKPSDPAKADAELPSPAVLVSTDHVE
jgi:hypothetical protein